MLRTRTTKTASSATAVQVVRYEGKRIVVVKHIGSAHSDQELAILKDAASQWIQTSGNQTALFPFENKQTEFFQNTYRYLGFRYTLIYDSIHLLLKSFRFGELDPLLLDLVLMRIIQPASKLESLELLFEFFGTKYRRADLYRGIPAFISLKPTIESAVVTVARNNFSFDFSIVFYDVTTLYFESFKSDEDQTDEKGVVTSGLRKNGFSKDHKHNQPQIVIGLTVTKEGFPVAYDVFEGNTFEGKTFIPSITKFKNTHTVKNLTVVADAAMISLENIQELIKNNLSYIVGARIANLKPQQFKQISEELVGKTEDLLAEELEKRDGSSMRIETERGLLICDFSLKRYRKDKREMEKQIAKAKKQLEEKDGVKRTKFLKDKDGKKIEQTINTELIIKTKLLLGIKGYYTNLTNETDKTIIDHYHNLWHVEKAFRIAKSDLAMRPIYHFKKPTIEAHILICFMALAICKYMELKTGKSTKKIIKLLKSVTEARVLNKLTGEIIVMPQDLPEETEQLWKTFQNHTNLDK